MLTNKFIIISLTPAKSKYQYTWLGWQSRDQNRTPTHPFPLPLLFSNVRRIASKRPPTLFQLIIPLIAMIELSRLRLWLFTSKTKYAGRILIGRRSSCLNENALNESLPCCFSTRDPSQFFPSISLLTRRMVKKLLSKFFFSSFAMDVHSHEYISSLVFFFRHFMFQAGLFTPWCFSVDHGSYQKLCILTPSKFQWFFFFQIFRSNILVPWPFFSFRIHQIDTIDTFYIKISKYNQFKMIISQIHCNLHVISKSY